ncbi:YbaB/EbfC family nucleoid-associated protein [Prosthecochloris sp. N3]|uniref:Nucleoid-associated protein INT08_07070 n=1 Tax=Prosthecochloris ethylica TaxID=2743976 RepID=A0ABR9XS96_9CHLB|nr:MULTISPECIES: YbaB/EbfC family nucleoid-associated protein [Prosthecochloris]MEC9486253.1 YbaB/EbfC family nucleoid-associated protein [Prosthecochloris sp.]MBF0586716.1 YbaB/EbfC family nucleoid-associated protein [Prosthecochloris ethylica]MBF0636930.1 YbaB/EbfC family nucleoid-associated protein [Prosthecochloris ethylica]NUK47801.1 YbaB/EbfC family nucleoid-associated protein [Prosthecochloris ethylica]RNA65048.1 YbaB/EbfC family nucleoid-associated protein [Prosthecochloris sp. ZM_2]
MANFNFNDMMGQLKQAGEKMQDVQKQLEKITAEGEAGGGMVHAVVNGKQKVLSVKIDPDILDDVEMVQDLVVAAVNNALEKALGKAQEEMNRAAGGMLGNQDFMKNFNFGK